MAMSQATPDEVPFELYRKERQTEAGRERRVGRERKTKIKKSKKALDENKNGAKMNESLKESGKQNFNRKFNDRLK